MAKFTFAQREEGFDNHIEHSIRGYTDLVNDVLKISEYFVENNSEVIDIGCSTGKLLKSMINQNTFAPSARYIGIELENDFYKNYNEDERNYPQLSYFRGDVRDFDFKDECSSFITSIFTLQFMPEDQRQDAIKLIYRSLKKGGAFVFSEKTIAETPKIQDIRTFTYYDYKRQNFTAEDILDKEKNLRHMMKLNTRNELVRMCATAGFEFESIDTFWQNYAFTGFIAIKS